MSFSILTNERGLTFMSSRRMSLGGPTADEVVAEIYDENMKEVSIESRNQNIEDSKELMLYQHSLEMERQDRPNVNVNLNINIDSSMTPTKLNELLNVINGCNDRELPEK
jgi:hypothetical protein